MGAVGVSEAMKNEWIKSPRDSVDREKRKDSCPVRAERKPKARASQSIRNEPRLDEMHPPVPFWNPSCIWDFLMSEMLGCINRHLEKWVSSFTWIGIRKRCPQYINFFFLFMAAPVANGSSWARRWIWAAAASLHHSHINTRSKLHLRPKAVYGTPLSEARDFTCILTVTTSGP